MDYYEVKNSDILTNTEVILLSLCPLNSFLLLVKLTVEVSHL